CPANEQFVEKDAKAIDVAPGIDVQSAHLGLFRTGITWGAYKLLELGEKRIVSKFLLHRFGNAEVNELRYRNAVVMSHKHVGWLKIAVNDAFLVRVLDRLNDL